MGTRFTETVAFVFQLFCEVGHSYGFADDCIKQGLFVLVVVVESWCGYVSIVTYVAD